MPPTEGDSVSKRLLGLPIAVLALALTLAACGGSSSGESSSGSGKEALVGAGSTLVAPLMSKWQPEFEKMTEIAVTYGAIGSGGGIEQITNQTVDFGASDAPLTEE